MFIRPAASRSLTALALTAAALLACSSSSSGTANDGSGSGPGSGTTNRALAGCSGSSSGQSKCTPAEEQGYTSCLMSKCDAQYTECLGSGYKNGTYAGSCGDYMNCIVACDCGNLSCLTACKATDACTTCLQKVSTCSSSCARPACYEAGGGGGGDAGGGGGDAAIRFDSGLGGGGTCADFQACCDRASTTYKQICQAQLDTLRPGGDANCGAILPGVRPTYCP